jgi:hypothetical protein
MSRCLRMVTSMIENAAHCRSPVDITGFGVPEVMHPENVRPLSAPGRVANVISVKSQTRLSWRKLIRSRSAAYGRVVRVKEIVRYDWRYDE